MNFVKTNIKIKIFKLLPIAVTLFMAFFSANAFSADGTCESELSNDTEAVKSFLTAHKNGEPNALPEILNMALNGSEAALSALNNLITVENDKKAQYFLGVMTLKLKKTPKDELEAEAVRLFVLAHKNGHPDALPEIQNMAKNGSEVAEHALVIIKVIKESKEELAAEFKTNQIASFHAKLSQTEYITDPVQMVELKRSQMEYITDPVQTEEK